MAHSSLNLRNNSSDSAAEASIALHNHLANKWINRNNMLLLSESWTYFVQGHAA